MLSIPTSAVFLVAPGASPVDKGSDCRLQQRLVVQHSSQHHVILHLSFLRINQNIGNHSVYLAGVAKILFACVLSVCVCVCVCICVFCVCVCTV